MHQVLVFLCVKSVPVPHVQPEERFLVGRIGPKQYRLYRCIARYGYHDVHIDDIEFEKDLMCSLAAFIQSNGSASTELNNLSEESSKEDDKMAVIGAGQWLQEVEEKAEHDGENSDNISKNQEIQSPIIVRKVRFVLPESPKMDSTVRDELRDLMEARESGLAFIMGNSYMKAKGDSSFMKTLALNVYDFLRRNSRGPSYAVSIPHASTLEVGMNYLV